MRYTTRPLSDRTWLRPPAARRSSQFTATYGDTLDMLSRETGLLGGRDVVIEVDVPESGIRRDGRGVLADARSESPAVVLAFESRHGPLLYRCDSHVRGAATVTIKGQPVRKMAHDWQHNLRAIALTLEALRAVDRYGATETGQQYTGFKALPGGGTPMPAPERMTSSSAAELLRAYGQGADSLSSCLRAAQRATHPDMGGRREDFERVQDAARVLGVA